MGNQQVLRLAYVVELSVKSEASFQRFRTVLSLNHQREGILLECSERETFPDERVSNCAHRKQLSGEWVLCQLKDVSTYLDCDLRPVCDLDVSGDDQRSKSLQALNHFLRLIISHAVDSQSVHPSFRELFSVEHGDSSKIRN